MLSPLDLALLLAEKVFLFMGIGAALARVGLYTPPVTQFVLRNLIVRLLLPLLIFEKVIGGLGLGHGKSALLMAAAAFVMIFGANGLARLSWRLVPALRGSGDTPIDRSFALVSSFHNYGYIVYPVAAALYGTEGLALAFVFALTCDALFWSFGVTIIEKDASVRWKEILNPPFVTMVLSVGLALGGLRSYLPSGSLEALGKVTVITIPLALTTIGGAFFHSIRSVQPDRLNLPAFGVSLALRALLIPALVAIPVLLMLPPSTARNIVLLEAVMPASVGVVILSALYDGDHAFVVSTSALSNLIGVVTIPLYLSWISRFS